MRELWVHSTDRTKRRQKKRGAQRVSYRLCGLAGWSSHRRIDAVFDTAGVRLNRATTKDVRLWCEVASKAPYCRPLLDAIPKKKRHHGRCVLTDISTVTRWHSSRDAMSWGLARAASPAPTRREDEGLPGF